MSGRVNVQTSDIKQPFHSGLQVLYFGKAGAGSCLLLFTDNEADYGSKGDAARVSKLSHTVVVVEVSNPTSYLRDTPFESMP